MGAYQYSKPRREEEPPSEGSLEEHTNSVYGDRAENQFGGQFGDVAREGWTLWDGRLRRIYVRNPLVQLRLAERLGERGQSLREWTADGLEAFAEHAYVPSDNVFRPMWADGTSLDGRTYDRTGYYGNAGESWDPLTADAEFLLSFARAHRVTGRTALWETARSIAKGIGIGDVGETPGEEVSLDVSAPGSSPSEVFALIELIRTHPHPQYVDRARTVADRMIEERYRQGFFIPTERHVHAQFDALEPLAILALEATLRGTPTTVPEYIGGAGEIHALFDGYGSDRVYDSEVLWNVTRDSQPRSVE